MKKLVTLVLAWAVSARHCLQRNPEQVIRVLDEADTPIKTLRLDDLPASLDWRDRNGVRYASWSRNQHIPNYCGSCWIMSTASALSDRIAIAQGGRFPEVDLAPQVVLNCDLGNNGCHGGDPNTAMEWIHKNGLPSETCQNYMAVGHDTGHTCNADDVCRNCQPSGGCFATPSYNLWYVEEHGKAVGEDEMMKELQRGPIVCGMAVTADFEKNYHGGIYKDTTGETQEMHAVSVVGYGEENGEKYWIVRNSWGNYWGEDGGYFRIVRGVNNLGIEANCDWATVSNGSRHNVSEPHKSRSELLRSFEPIPPVIGDARKEVQRQHKTCRPEKTNWDEVGGERVLSALPHTYLDVNDLPTEFTWANVNGTNFLTTARNQHIPQYCGSCWAFGTTSALSDRLNILRARAGESLFPEINIAPQILINEDGGGSCNGGNPGGVYSYIHRNGIPDETCQAYQAKNNPHGHGASPLNICENCVPGNTSSTFTPGTCSQVTNFTKYWVTEYGSVRGADRMKAEIYARGPIGAGMDVTPEFEKYTGGIYSQKQLFPMINHEVSVVGWGVENGVEFWHVRNSWGTYFGEKGYFRIKMHGDNLGIESECDWGVPSFSQP